MRDALLFIVIGEGKFTIESNRALGISQHPIGAQTITMVLALPKQGYSTEDGLIILWAVPRS